MGEKKENNERVPFYLLLVPVTHRGGSNRCGKKWRRAQSMAGRPTAAAAATETKRGKNQKNRLDPRREEGAAWGRSARVHRGRRSGAVEGCIFLCTRKANLPIVRRLRIRIENYCIFTHKERPILSFFKKIRMGNKNGELL